MERESSYGPNHGANNSLLQTLSNPVTQNVRNQGMKFGTGENFLAGQYKLKDNVKSGEY